jgi:hypothetical protein
VSDSPTSQSERQLGYRVVWTHHRSGDVFTGDWWAARSDAEYIADMLRDSGYCLNVHIRRAREAR